MRRYLISMATKRCAKNSLVLCMTLLFGIQLLHLSINQCASNDSDNYSKRFISNQGKAFDFKSAMASLNEAKAEQDDPRLIQLIRDYYIDSPTNEAILLQSPSVVDTSRGQSLYIDEHLNMTRGGFFVECGAFDGEWLSNTMFFERARNWTGILIEADPVSYRILKSKNRRAYSVNACLATTPYPSMVTFSRADVRGRIEEDEEQKRWIKEEQWRTIEKTRVQCFPLASILLALGTRTIDYLSLDIEGDELKVLKTLPMKEFKFKTMTVEVRDKTEQERNLTSYLRGHGFRKVSHLKTRYAHDNIYTIF